MRRAALAIAAALAVSGAVSLASGRAEAMTLAVPAGAKAAVVDLSPAERIAYVCRPIWACTPYGCGWRRSCYWTPGRSYRPYYRPYHRPYWRYRR